MDHQSIILCPNKFPLVLEAAPIHINGQPVWVLSVQDSYICFPKSERKEKEM